MNKFVSYEIKPYVYISNEGDVEKCNELVNLNINEKLEGYIEQVILYDNCYTVKYIDEVLKIEWETTTDTVVSYTIEEGILLDSLAVKQLEELLSQCEESMEEYIINHTQPVQE
ncbi:hypothetical protein [Veillonella sp. CHU110]|uniref:hypothetical protein n=1 Tax=Veillonella sp. CHU110 TaxID=2490947 RepID=UPI000F8EB4DA|nr:hypothetical protein [Veillonella sp. CHU110]